MTTAQRQAGYIDSHPILNVQNVPASLDYYCSKLGYKKDFTWPDQVAPTFAQVSRGRSSLMLAQGEQGGPGMWIYLDVNSVEDLSALYQEYAGNGAKITAPPTDKPWNMREMLVQDLDGHILRIGAPLSE